jgi:hypothetical protein
MGKQQWKRLLKPVLDFDSSANEITTVAPVKKKLRVIHINDTWSTPGKNLHADNQFIERDRFQLKILNNETITLIPHKCR